MLLRLDDVEQQLREMTCAEVLADEDLGWTFADEVDDWSVSIHLQRPVERRSATVLVPLVCQGRKGRGFFGHRGNTVHRTIELHCR